jgi:hypothetical protein
VLRHPLSLPLALALSFVVGVPAIAGAQDRPDHDALEAPLRGFTAADVRRLEPLLAQGTVGLVELPHGQLLPAVHLATVVHAPASTVADVVAHPEAYPRFMPAVSEVTVTEREGDVTGFSWRWRTAIFALEGQAMLTLYAPPPAHAERGYRVAVERTEGDLGHGREVWRILPRDDGTSVVTLSARMDLRDANYLARQVAAAARSLNRSVNLAMAFAMLLRAQDEAEHRAGFARPDVTADLHRPRVDLQRYEPLLRRGDMLLIESNGAELRQCSVMTRLEHPESRVRSIMLNPIAFTEALIAGSHAEIRERTERGVAFDWRVDLPIVGTRGAMTLGERDDRVIELDATGGAMDGGRWRFATQRLASGATAVLGWARFDVGSANFLLQAIVDADAGFRPGLSAATEIMMARALRIRVRRR